MKYATITAMMLIIGGCAAISGREIVGVVFPMGSDLPYSINGKLKAEWQPSKTIIKEAEPIILEYIKKSDGNIFKNLNQYRCQYFGIEIDGRKVIYCNFFMLSEEEDDWRMGPVSVLDGGDCYFQLEYDVETRRCLNFSVNGEA